MIRRLIFTLFAVFIFVSLSAQNEVENQEEVQVKEEVEVQVQEELPLKTEIVVKKQEQMKSNADIVAAFWIRWSACVNHIWIIHLCGKI